MLVDPPHAAWYRPGAAPATGIALARGTRTRDVETARALRAYLATRPAVTVRTTVETTL
ncbi:MAG: hypothetical protein JWN08_3642 [Frankiales bacterium]|nr:hypothetical protein [Frankiales bacterium]